MDSSSKSTGHTVTTTKEKTAHSNRSRLNENTKHRENFDPNVTSSPGLKLTRSPSISAKKSGFSKVVNPNQSAYSPSPKKKIRDRKFVIAKKKLRKHEEEEASSSTDVVCEKCDMATVKSNSSKCLCLAYDSLRASQDDFFKNRDDDFDFDKLRECDDDDGCESNSENNELGLKRSRDKLLEEARESVPEAGFGRVMHLVKAFEKLRMMQKSDVSEENEVEDDKKVVKWALPGLQQPPPKASETQISSSSSLSPSDFFVTSESLGVDSGRFYSLDSSQDSISRRTSTGGRKSRRSSGESSGTLTKRNWKRKQKKEISQKPFMLRTEQRGRCKEEEFMKKLQQMLEEEEKLRLPVAQGLPRTTDEPEFLVKPPVKEITRPVDLVLHSDTRAAERTEFDNQVIKKMNLIEHYRMERERQQKLAEEEEIRRLRKELVPKAQPMPYFDRPFIPRRSGKQPTMPKDPKFHFQNKKIKCHLSLDDLYTPLE